MKIYNWNQQNDRERQEILARPYSSKAENLAEKVQEIIKQVQSQGDRALLELTAKYDFAQLIRIQVSEAEFKKAGQQVAAEVMQAIRFAKSQIETIHQAQLPRPQTIQTCPGIFCERQFRPIERVGLYIPGGSAPLVSTLLMLAVPAQIANNPLRIICTPPNPQGEINPYLLAAAELCGIQKIYKVGGVQAIAAMAYGTETIEKVDKILGPGNAWVAQAKILVAQDPAGAAIDLPAGPSEVLVIADNQANPEYVAADLLSQAEHGIDSQVILITFNETLASAIQQAIQDQLENLPRSAIAKQALEHGRIIIATDIQQALAISNIYAPEHLILQVAYPEKYTTLIKNAGAVFLGPFTPETLGDYVTGSNHVLPTHGHARTYSGLSVNDFIKFINFQTATKAGLENIGPFAETLAEIEGLRAHKRAVSLRLKQMVMNNE